MRLSGRAAAWHRSLGLLALLPAALGAVFGALTVRAEPVGTDRRPAELLV